MPLFRCKLCANALIERETGNAPVIRAQDRSFRMDNEMLERRKRESHGPAAFKVDTAESAIDFAAEPLSRLLDGDQIVRDVHHTANGAGAYRIVAGPHRLQCFG